MKGGLSAIEMSTSILDELPETRTKTAKSSPTRISTKSIAVEIQNAFQRRSQSLTSALDSNGKTVKVLSANMAEFHATIHISTILHRDYNQGEASTCFIVEKPIRTSYRHVPDTRPVCCIHGH
jgi:hypothetical protein